MIHSTGDKELDVKSLLSLVHNILSTASDAAGVQMACKAQGEAVNNVEKKTEAILKVLSSYSMDAKLGLSLAFLALEYGELWHLQKDLKTSRENNNSQEKEFFQAMAILKSVTNIGSEKALSELNTLINLIMDVTRIIFELEKLRSHYSASQLSKVIGKHVYQAITTIVACATQITILKNNKGQLHDLSKMTSDLNTIYKDLQKHKQICHQQKELEIYMRLIMLKYARSESHDVVVEILKLMIYAELDVQKLLIGGSTTDEMEEEDMDVLRTKDVFLIILSLDISDDEISSIISKKEIMHCIHFNIVWIPIVDKWTSEQEKAFHEKRKKMPWYIVQYVSTIAGIRFIKDEWEFKNKPIGVLMTADGDVVTRKSLNLIQNLGYESNPKHHNLVWHSTATKAEPESKSEESKLITNNDADSAVQSNTANHPQDRSDDNNHESNDQPKPDVEHESDLNA
ncbi:hypothetical protein FNV43_RR01538 [Rhamnella rubrinervis]|uniref:Sieve element occlusion N-terminal domain-containing protein n=1 Tax=Rhamnella rubrinervis TaxID=2594499 RepID=A0A8K0HSP1_9ROSA|nr:hypothetical protein FNV43_RR01538 [Rhamnella rubrinervis]